MTARAASAVPERGAARGLGSFEPGGTAVVFGASGGIGAALLDALRDTGRFASVTGFSRRSVPAIDLADEASLERAVAAATAAGAIRLAVDATGFLHDAGGGPEKSWRELDAGRLAHAFAMNAIGPALLMTLNSAAAAPEREGGAKVRTASPALVMTKVLVTPGVPRLVAPKSVWFARLGAFVPPGMSVRLPTSVNSGVLKSSV